LATYAVEGSSSKDYRYVKGMLYENPAAMHRLLDKLAQSVVSYLNAQIEAGAQAVMIFDTWGGVLSPEAYIEFSLNYMQQIVSQLKRDHDGQTIPVTLFTKGGAQWIEAMADTGCDAIGLDWTINISEAKQRVGNKVALQGNLDPCALYAAPDTIRGAVKKIMTDFGSGPGHVFNLGHGIHPSVNPDHLKVVVDAVHEYGFEIRQ
jgi:uroporphyrinogen decarboxylase